jgi:aminoglycoside 6-adenylyltransferase
MVKVGIPVEVVAILQRGVRILLDKDGLVASLQAAAGEQLVPQPPTQAEFLRVVHDFWYHTVWTAKHLRRGEVWWAKLGCDVRLKELLRQMLEWHARALKGQSYDTWLRGRFLEKWADPRALAQLREAFAHYDEEDIWRALFVTMNLFRWLAIEAAERLGYAYPTLGDERASGLVDDMFARRSAGRKQKKLRNSL